MTEAPSDLLWVVDDLPSVRFPVYCRGNVGEVYPNVITPLCGSIVKGPFAKGQEAVFRDMGAIVNRDLGETGRAVLTGCFGGYLYANLSLGRLLGARAPGMRPTDVDVQLFGTTDAPPHRPQPGDRSAAATARLGAFLVRILRGPSFDWLAAERRDIERWAATRPSPSTASIDQLFATVDEGTARLAPLMRSLLLASSYAGMAAAVVERMATKADAATRAKLAVGVGDVESAQPAVELWRLGQLVNEAPAVAAAFEGGGAINSRLVSLGAEADHVRAGLADFVERFGARGPDEWELASDTWGTNPDIALAAVERLRHSTAANPTQVYDRLARDRRDAIEATVAHVPPPARRLFRRVTDSAAQGTAGREFAKGTIVLALYAIRLALFELVRRAQDAGGPADARDCWLFTRDEFPSFLANPAAHEERIAVRRQQRDLLESRVPPFVFDGVIPDPSTWRRRNDPSLLGTASPGAVLAGLAVSPGRYRGRVRVVRDPSDPGSLAPGEVLVAPITDPAWTPLFLVADAVVCEVGANMSHAAIVARELGIPAVVSVGGATQLLRDGTLVEVDGTTGRVTVLNSGANP